MCLWRCRSFCFARHMTASLIASLLSRCIPRVPVAPSVVGPHRNQDRTSQCTRACTVGGWLILHEAMSVRAARYGSRTPYYRRIEAAAVDIMRWSCGRASADGLGTSVSRVGPHHNQVRTMQCTRACNVGEERLASWPALQSNPHRSVHARLLCGRTADSSRDDEHASRSPRGSNAASPTDRSRSR